MLSLLTESLSARFMIAVVLAAACTFLYWKIRKRRQATEKKPAVTPDGLLSHLEKTFFEGKPTEFQKFLRSQITTEAYETESASGGGGEDTAEAEKEKEVEKVEEKENLVPKLVKVEESVKDLPDATPEAEKPKSSTKRKSSRKANKKKEVLKVE